MKFYCGKLKQYIDMPSVLQYVDNLKTRIYKAFYKKSRLKAHRLQLLCINSPLVILMAAKSNAEAEDYHFDLFELGYLLFSLSNNFYIDTSFYAYYKENTFVDISYLLRCLIEKIKSINVAWSIEPYQAYLFHKPNFIFCGFDNNYDLSSTILNDIYIFKYSLCFNLESCFSYFFIHALIKRLSINQNIKSYLLKYLRGVKFNNLMSYFGFLPEHAVLLRSNKQLSVKLFSVFIYFICIDIYNTLNALNQRNSVLFTSCHFDLIILSHNCLELNLLAKELAAFLRFNGVKLMHTSRYYSVSLFNGVSCALLSIGVLSSIYPFYFVIRPSLFSQFGLMRRISFIISYSVSQPLFLLIIRLNKLLLFWGHIYLSSGIGRIFYLIDYLVYLKIRLFIKKHCFFIRKLSNSFFLKLQGGKSAINLNELSDSLVESVFTDCRYRQYASVRMFWIHLLKCLSI